jgi:hypothetical protein
MKFKEIISLGRHHQKMAKRYAKKVHEHSKMYSENVKKKPNEAAFHSRLVKHHATSVGHHNEQIRDLKSMLSEKQKKQFQKAIEK